MVFCLMVLFGVFIFFYFVKKKNSVIGLGWELFWEVFLLLSVILGCVSELSDVEIGSSVGFFCSFSVGFLFIVFSCCVVFMFIFFYFSSVWGKFCVGVFFSKIVVVFGFNCKVNGGSVFFYFSCVWFLYLVFFFVLGCW